MTQDLDIAAVAAAICCAKSCDLAVRSVASWFSDAILAIEKFEFGGFCGLRVTVLKVHRAFFPLSLFTIAKGVRMLKLKNRYSPNFTRE
jgi:hypothetical protein